MGDVLVPALRPGNTFVMGNLPAHRSPAGPKCVQTFFKGYDPFLTGFVASCHVDCKNGLNLWILGFVNFLKPASRPRAAGSARGDPRPGKAEAFAPQQDGLEPLDRAPDCIGRMIQSGDGQRWLAE